MSNLALFTPLMRQTVGFDRFNDLFETVLNETEDRFEAYPPYNIEKLGEDEYQISVAVAGFSEKDLDITVEGNSLLVSGKIKESEKGEIERNYLHRGIATRAFQRSFRLEDHVFVEDAALKDGLLTIHLKREIPEEKKPRMIPINGKDGSILSGKKKKK